MSSRDGAVMRMAGGPEEQLAESDSDLDCAGGALSVTEREDMSLKYQRQRKHTD